MNLQSIIEDFGRRRNLNLDQLEVRAPDVWNLRIEVTAAGLGRLVIRSLAASDIPVLHDFGRRLSEHDKELFCPYPWREPDKLDAAFAAAIAQATRRVDASYVMELDGHAAAHFFLWKGGGNPQSQAAGLQIPELGVAVVHEHQGIGLGSLAVRILQTVARAAGADAVELTTATFNDAGWATYQRAGFEYVGILRIALDVDVTAAEAGLVTATRFRDERQMVYIINAAKRQAVLDYLARKRGG